MPDVTVPVPDDRVPEFYQFFGAWLAGAQPPITADSQQESNPHTGTQPWVDTDEDLVLAQGVWERLSKRARAMMNLLMESPGAKLSGEVIAQKVGIPNGKYGVAGVLAWPGRHCLAVGRKLPIRYEEGPVGESANYWIESHVAALFTKAKNQIRM